MALEKTFVTPASHEWSGSLPASAAVRAGDLVFVSGQVSADANLQTIASGDVGAQARKAFDCIRALVETAGGSMDDIVDIVSFHKDPREIAAVFAVGHEVFRDSYPAWTAMGMTGTYRPEMLVNIRAIAHLGEGRKECFTPDALRWCRELPISGGCRKGDYLFISGQLAADSSGEVIAPSRHAEQARYAYDRFKEIVEMAGGSLDDIIDIMSFNQDVREMDATHDVWCNEFVPDVPTENTTSYTAIGTTGLYKPGMVGTYRAIADFSPGPRIATNLPSVHWYNWRISGATKKKDGRLITCSGQVPSDGERNIISRGDVRQQARYCLRQIQGVLEKHGASLADVVDVISFHKDARDWETVMDVGREHFPTDQGPAWTVVGCTGLYLEGYLHEIHAVAVV